MKHRRLTARDKCDSKHECAAHPGLAFLMPVRRLAVPAPKHLQPCVRRCGRASPFGQFGSANSCLLRATFFPSRFAWLRVAAQRSPTFIRNPNVTLHTTHTHTHTHKSMEISERPPQPTGGCCLMLDSAPQSAQHQPHLHLSPSLDRTLPDGAERSRSHSSAPSHGISQPHIGRTFARWSFRPVGSVRGGSTDPSSDGCHSTVSTSTTSNVILGKSLSPTYFASYPFWIYFWTLPFLDTFFLDIPPCCFFFLFQNTN
jgi:hypothetical protein